MTDAAPLTAPGLDAETIAFVTRNMRGILTATVSFYETSPEFEEDFMALLTILKVTANANRIERIAPAPARRISFQFNGRAAKLLVTENQPLIG